MTWRRAAQFALGMAISGACLWLAVRQIALDQVRAAILAARWWFLAPAVATYFLDLAVRAWRWSVLLHPVTESRARNSGACYHPGPNGEAGAGFGKDIGWRRLMPAMVIGYMGNMLLPARLGEVLRAVVLGRRHGLASAALGTIATERVLDGLTTIALLLVAFHPRLGIFGFVTAPAWLSTGLTAVTALFLVALVALGALLAFRPRVHRLLIGLSDRFAWAQRPDGWAEQFLDGLAVLRNRGLLAEAVGISLLAWTLSALEYTWILLAFDLRLGLVAPFFAVSAVGLSTVIPSAPGYVGTFEFAGMAVLTVLGVAPPTAFSATVLLHLVEILPVTVVGLFLLWREGIAFADLRDEGRRTKDG